MGIFYKYRCRNCGKKYSYLPENCECCGTELSFICPMDVWNVRPEYKQTTDCEEIFEIAFLFGKKSRIKELERKISRLNSELLTVQEEVSELRNEKSCFETKMDLKNDIISSLKRENAELKHKNLLYKAAIKQHQSSETNKGLSVSQDAIVAVRYAMKKSHPDNGGNADDFNRFRKCYEELMRK